jgi:hypothetical protein
MAEMSELIENFYNTLGRIMAHSFAEKALMKHAKNMAFHQQNIYVNEKALKEMYRVLNDEVLGPKGYGVAMFYNGNPDDVKVRGKMIVEF